MKNVQYPEEIQKIVDEVMLKDIHDEDAIVEQVKSEHKGQWDIPIDQEVVFFDTDLSYELTGYIPINKTSGLDFDPDWFTEARDSFLRTGHYTQFHKGTKAFQDFWLEEYKRCKHGMTVNGYTITGDNYFFLNYFQLMDLDNTEKSGGGRLFIFPAFYAGQYEFFHYYEMCKRLRRNAVIMKAREVGYSEMLSAILANSYNCIKNSINMLATHRSDYLDNTIGKVWNCLAFLNDNTDGGFFKLRQVKDSTDWKRSSHYKIINGQKIEVGWMSQIIGIVADNPSKLRGFRLDILAMDEVGSWKNFAKAYIQATALVGPMNASWGIRVCGGTSGDTKESLDGLQRMFYHPEVYGILPHRHRYTQNGAEVLTSFFIPCTKIPKDRKRFLSHRGFVDPDAVVEWQNEIRAAMASDPTALIDHCAEYPFNDTEAFSSGVQNKFNRATIAEQLTRIRAMHECPPIDIGTIRFQYKNTERKVDRAHVQSVIWNACKDGKIKILEHPLWVEDKERDGQSQGLIEKTNNLYVAGIDGIDIGMLQTSSTYKDPSDFCMVVKRRTFGNRTPRYVAIYKDRPDDIREAYEIAIGLAMYYNCQINIEATRMSMVTWARDRHLLNYFMKRPSATYPDIARRKTQQYGSPASPAVIDHQTDLIKDFVLDYGYDIWFEEMLDELSRYSDENKRKFDIVAAMGECELADEELSGITPQAQKKADDEFVDFGYYYDERGIKHFGPIKKNNQMTANFNMYLQTNDYSYGQVRSSDPRNYF